ncbi:hypothetical protein M409DRAFT_53066 [Zasmidium cellare ATCC 36951]|uniref:RING-type domain-containing protein n=1 Tax=Zasmidium cellare ATCC 36951 TaxID=1080233 RepID=A0A6A6CSC6_ZASCE|nr:uncharacterized protein M409DRAFT_53066 [Zasmidium cellare ATCC 36951]KAF2168376.1 hypothetical protein M409DRAFT_53066 [Zasmidium cellare ATCC 36951]
MDNPPAASSTRADDAILSTLKPHHSVDIEFPCRELLQDGEGMILPHPWDIEERHQPFPLAPDDTIEQRWPWLNVFDTRRASYYPVEAVFDPELFSEDDDELRATDDLAADMARLINKFEGSTTLELLTYVPLNLNEDDAPKCEYDIRVRIRRTTLLDGEDAQADELQPAIYESTVRDWRSMMRSDAVVHAWQDDIVHLMHQDLDQDVRHVQLKMEDSGLDYEDWVNCDLWQKPRQMPIDQGIAKITTTLTKPELDQFNETLADDDKLLQCPSCLEDYDESTTNTAVLLPCSKKHCLCLTCLKQWCIQNGLDKVSCPYCRQRLTPPEMAQQVKPNYLDIDGQFEQDSRFTDYENAERSYAPLDRVASSEDDTLTVVDQDVLIEAWNKIVPNGYDDYTPERLTPVKAPEAWFFFRSFLQTVRQQHGKTLQAKKLYRTLRRNTFEALRAEFVANGKDKFLCAQSKAIIDENAARTPMRFDIRPFVDKSLNRIVQLSIKSGTLNASRTESD